MSTCSNEITSKALTEIPAPVTTLSKSTTDYWRANCPENVCAKKQSVVATREPKPGYIHCDETIVCPTFVQWYEVCNDNLSQRDDATSTYTLQNLNMFSIY